MTGQGGARYLKRQFVRQCGKEHAMARPEPEVLNEIASRGGGMILDGRGMSADVLMEVASRMNKGTLTIRGGELSCGKPDWDRGNGRRRWPPQICWFSFDFSCLTHPVARPTFQ